MMRLAILVGLAALGAAQPASAELRTTAKVRYETQSGMSAWTETTVTFDMGSELNDATKTFNYSLYTAYAVIFFAPNQAAVIKRSGITICSGKFIPSCLPVIGGFTGDDQSGRHWEICTAVIC